MRAAWDCATTASLLEQVLVALEAEIRKSLEYNPPPELPKKDLRPDVVIAVLLSSTEFTDSDVASIVGVFARAFSAGTARNERESVKLANVLVTPETGKFGVGDYSKAKELIEGVRAQLRAAE